MKYGIRETEQGTLCFNCEKLITKDDVFVEEFCPTCGAPLTREAVEIYEDRVKDEQHIVINAIEGALKNHDIKKILEDLKEEIKK